MKLHSQAIPVPLASWDFYALHHQHICHTLPEIEQLNQMAKDREWDDPIDFSTPLLVEEQVLVITDPALHIQFASGNIFRMNGYQASELIGQQPRIFQGPDTCLQTTRRISLAIRDRKPFEEVVVNYRKNGEKYKCWIKGEPLWNTRGELVNFVAYEKEVA